MTNQQNEPSKGSIIYAGIWTVFLNAVAGWLLWGAETNREFVGTIVTIVFGLTLAGQLFSGLAKRSEAIMVARRRALEQEMEARVHDPDFPQQYKPGPY